MKLSRNRIDDAPELDVHSSRFVTVTASRVCAGAWANVHDTLVSVWWKRKCERRSWRRPIPKYRRHHRPIDSPSRSMHLTLELPSGKLRLEE